MLGDKEFCKFYFLNSKIDIDNVLLTNLNNKLSTFEPLNLSRITFHRFSHKLTHLVLHSGFKLFAKVDGPNLNIVQFLKVFYLRIIN